MEAVHIFNKELKSILECKLPVSRHKMSLITKSAMKALKFYKHVVQSVEKFITKCTCDYKVPGLYVIDAIVRQSKHQYCDKDVFVPRFMRNIVTTFTHLSQCNPNDLISIERVLRLWQQNGVFPTDLVEALLELVYNASDKDKVIKASSIVLKLVNATNSHKGKAEEKLDLFIPHRSSVNNDDDASKDDGTLIDSITKLLTRYQKETGEDVTLEINQIQILHQNIMEQSELLAKGDMIDSETLTQLHISMDELTKSAAKAASVQQCYLDSDKDRLDGAAADAEFVEQMQQMVDTLGQTRVLQQQLTEALELRKNVPNGDRKFTPQNELEEGEDPFDNDVAMEGNDVDSVLAGSNSVRSDRDSIDDRYSKASSVESRKRRRSSSSPRVKKKRKRSRSKERKKKEKKKRDGRKKYMATVRPECVSVLSHTIFIGHLHKHVSELKLRSMCVECGPVSEFNMIPPRGCAFVTFDRRKSAYKAVQTLNELHFEGRELKVAWAPNKGVKDRREMREWWSVEEGCTYVPWGKWEARDWLGAIEGGGEIDQASLSDQMRRNAEEERERAAAVPPPPPSAEPPPAKFTTVQAPVIDPKAAAFYTQFPAPPPPLISQPPPPSISYPPPPPPHTFLQPPPLPPVAVSTATFVDFQVPPPALATTASPIDAFGVPVVSTATFVDFQVPPPSLAAASASPIDAFGVPPVNTATFVDFQVPPPALATTASSIDAFGVPPPLARASLRPSNRFPGRPAGRQRPPSTGRYPRPPPVGCPAPRGPPY